MNTNPLLNLGFEIPFDRIEAAHVEPASEALIAQAQAKLDEIAALSGPRTYGNTMAALDAATEDLELMITVVGHLESVVSSPELREAYNKVKPKVSAFFAGIPLNQPLYEAIKAYDSGSETLSGPQKRFYEKTLRDFKRHGAELNEEGKARLQQITEALAEKTSKYSQNVLDATQAWSLTIEDEAQLAGLPQSAKDAAKARAEEKEESGYRFTLQAPSLIPLITYLDDRSVREKTYRAYNTRAADAERNNEPLALEILALRNEKAKLLGYRDFADLVLEERMAKTGDEAKKFVEALREKSQEAFTREGEALLAFRRELEGPDAPALAPWDLGYYSEKQRKARFDFDEEALRPYFPADRAIEGVFSTAQRLYGVRIKPRSDLPVWHESVQVYDIEDPAQNERLGTFYVDLFPRETKRGGAWMNGLITGMQGEKGHAPHLGLICANVTPPLKDQPALLTHNELTTLFHEFGHLLHHLLSRVQVRSLGGTNVAWDFVELPSQIMENWCWEREALDLFAAHHESGEKIPEALFSRMVAARTYREATAMMRQLGFASVDLKLHTEYDPAKDGSLVSFARGVMQSFAPAPYPEDYAFICSFSHIFGSAVGYAAGYYSYKWAEVLDADAFTRFQKEGIFNTEVGEAFRKAILERGDEEDPSQLYEGFMGRAPELEPLLVRSGLVGGGQA